MSKKKEKILIIDGNALIHRSFHAIPPTMQNKKGEPTNAVFGFTNVLLKSIKEFNPKYVVLTLDKKGPTFRHKKYKEYKATRKKAPDELYTQIPIVKKVAKAFNIPIYEESGFEADDLIGTLSKRIEKENVNSVESVIVTGDMDTLQLITDNTKVYTMSRGVSESVIYDDKKVRERYDINVDQVIEYKALKGDPSDNIPGVRGVGDKTAVELLKNFKNLEGIYKNIESEKIKDRIRGLLLEYKKNAFMSRELATIKCDIEIDFDLKKTEFTDFNKEDVVSLFTELEFKSLLPRILDLKKDDKSVDVKIDKFKRNKKEFNYKLINSEIDFKNFLKELKKQKQFTFDTETSDFNTMNCDLLGISFSWKKGEAFYIDFSMKLNKKEDVNLFNYNSSVKEVDDNWFIKLREIFEDEKIKKCAHNIKFDIRVLNSQGIDVKGIYFDTMIASYLLNPGTRQHNLDDLTFSEFGFEKINKEDLLGKGRDKITFPEVETEKLSNYSCEDADFTNRLVGVLKKKVKENKLEKIFKEIEMPLVEVLTQVENNGVKINKSFFSRMSKDLEGRIKKIEKQIHKLAGEVFNIKSTKQLKEILFKKLEISTLGIKKTKTGFSTGADELEKIKNEHEIIPLIQEYRELTKLTSTYINNIPLLVNKKTKRLHTNYNQTVVATGRLSSTDPNLQNIPIKTELGREIRKGFKSQTGYKIVALDYSQIELRLAAHLSGDKNLVKAFINGKDIHSSTAASINDVDIENITKQMRREAKAINFGILYGQGPHGLSQTADIPYNQAREFIEKYFSVYKGVKDYLDKTIEFARENEYVETLFGRKRNLPEINSTVMMVKKGAERMAINTPLQGTSADMIKIAMIKVFDYIKKYRKNKNEADVKMIMQVHDELIFEIKDSLVKEVSQEIKKIMEEVIDLKVPVVVDVSVGDNWGELKNI